MAAGVAQDDEANLAAAKAFVTHLIETVGPEDYDEVFGVIVLHHTFLLPIRVIWSLPYVAK